MSNLIKAAAHTSIFGEVPFHTDAAIEGEVYQITETVRAWNAYFNSMTIQYVSVKTGKSTRIVRLYRDET